MDLGNEERALADALYEAYRTGEPCPTPEDAAEMSLADGYAVQRAVVERRQTEEGPQVGYKVGYTARTLRAELDVDGPAWGRLLAGTVRSDGRLDIGGLIDPMIEVELAVRLGEPLAPPVTPADVLATATIHPAIEVPDSRTVSRTPPVPVRVADNVHSGLVVLGDGGRPATAFDPALEGVRVRRDGETVATGVGADVLDGPANVVAWLADALADVPEEGLSAGDLVLTGSTTGLLPLAAGETIEARFAALGTVSLHAIDGTDGE